MELLYMTPKNGDLLSLLLKQLIDAGNLARFKKMTEAASYLHLFIKNVQELDTSTKITLVNTKNAFWVFSTNLKHLGVLSQEQ